MTAWCTTLTGFQGESPRTGERRQPAASTTLPVLGEPVKRVAPLSERRLWQLPEVGFGSRAGPRRLDRFALKLPIKIITASGPLRLRLGCAAQGVVWLIQIDHGPTPMQSIE